MLAFILHFPGGWGKSRETPKSTSDLTPAFFYFLLSLSKCAYAGNKRHVSSLEKLITGLCSPDINVWPREAEKRTGGGHPKHSAEQSQGTGRPELTTLYSVPLCFWVLPHRLLLFVCFISIFCSKAIWLSIWRKVCVWCGVIFKDTYLTRSSFLDRLGN